MVMQGRCDKMRQYRGMTKEGKWVYGWFFKDGDVAYILISKLMMGGSLIINRIVDGMYEVIPETVGQQTGLKDKNKKEGYVGDIIAFNVIKAFGTDIRYKGEVYFCEKRLAYCVKCLPAWDMPIKRNLINIEIIGTIHDKE